MVPGSFTARREHRQISLDVVGQEYEVGQSGRNAMQLTLVVQQKGFIDCFTEKDDLVMFRRA